MRRWRLILIVLAAVVVMALVANETIARLARSTTAARLGLDNMPKGRDRDRLVWTAKNEDTILSILRELFPGAHTTSGYRSPEVNAAVGGADTSRHRYGLALDFGGIGGIAQTRAAATHLRANADRIPVRPRTVIAEDDHVHVDWSDPFRELENEARATVWLQEQPGQTPRFVALA